MTVHQRTPEARQDLRAQMLTCDRWTISHLDFSLKPQLSPELFVLVSAPSTAPSAVLTDVALRPPLSYAITTACLPPTMNSTACPHLNRTVRYLQRLEKLVLLL